ncbi:MAG: DUF4003 family protein [Eubacteriales bacterium]|nr:DUF4003 family protein [Eubacteriales bacterium]
MNPILRNQCELLVENRKTVSSVFWSDFNILRITCASLYAGKNRRADADTMRECRRIVRKKKNFVSDFRGNINSMIVARMSMSASPEKYFDDLLEINGMFKRNKLIGSEYRILSAMIINDTVGPAKAKEHIDRLYEIYDGMSKRHAFLTSPSDLPMAAVISCCDLDADKVLEEMEQCFSVVKTKFRLRRGAVQSCSHVLSLNPADASSKCSKFFEVWDKLKESGHKYGSDYQLAVLAALSGLDMSTDEMVRDIMDADDYLKHNRGFGNFILGAKMRRMFAALLTISSHAESAASEASVAGSSAAIAAALEICMMIVMMTIMMSTTHYTNTNSSKS